MVEPSEHIRVERPDDPERCERMHVQGQCSYKRIPGSPFCAQHTSGQAHAAHEKTAARHYLAAQWRAQVGTFADDDKIKSLRTEIGILRLLLQKTMERCRSDNDLLMRSSSIGELILKIEKLVVSCHKLDTNLGETLDKGQLSLFGNTIIAIVSEFINDPQVLGKFAERLVKAIKDLGSAEARVQAVEQRMAGDPSMS